MHLKNDIKDEEKGHERYESLAKSDCKNRAIFKKMSEDEERHESKLKKIESEEAKTKALKKRMRGMSTARA